jgi:hypothetical protein
MFIRDEPGELHQQFGQFLACSPFSFPLIQNFRIILTLNQTVSVSPTPAATASGAPTVTSTVQKTDKNDNKQAVIGTATGLGSFIIAVVSLGSLWLGWKQYQQVKATRSLSSQNAGSPNIYPQPISPIASNPNNLSPAINMPPSDAMTPRNSDVGAAENVEPSATNERSPVRTISSTSSMSNVSIHA